MRCAKCQRGDWIMKVWFGLRAGLLLAFVFLSTLALQPGIAQTAKWTWQNPLPQGNTLHGVTYGNGLYVAVGEWGTILTSRKAP